MPSPSWRKIEAALTAVAQAYGYSIDEHRDAGDKFVAEVLIHPSDDIVEDLNLTELAKDLERELA